MFDVDVLERGVEVGRKRQRCINVTVLFYLFTGFAGKEERKRKFVFFEIIVRAAPRCLLLACALSNGLYTLFYHVISVTYSEQRHGDIHTHQRRPATASLRPKKTRGR